MCIAFLAWQIVPNQPIVLAANRDEFYSRSTQPMHFWEDNPQILAGRDLQAGGTWLGLSRSGRIAFLTNFREPGDLKFEGPSRGEVPLQFLTFDGSIEAFAAHIKNVGPHYNGFNLIFGDSTEMFHFSNRGGAPTSLKPGYHGLSNHLLNTPWPKVQKGRKELAELDNPLEMNQLFNILGHTETARDEDLPNTGVGLDLERMLSPIFIRSEQYGTRSGTALTVGGNGEVFVEERTYSQHLQRFTAQNFNFQIQDSVKNDHSQ